jgi:hypothetical protein
MAERLALQRAAEAEYERERAMVDEVVARIQAEDRMEAEARRANQEETKAYIRDFLLKREEEVFMKRQESMEEEKKIQEYWDMVSGGAGLSLGYASCMSTS